jgi:hypothetical protein
MGEGKAALSEAIDDLILGRGVARGRHVLRHEGRDVTAKMTERLPAHGFRPMTVREVQISPGERVPAFRLAGGIADFGYVRWEIFTPRSRRKLFASEFRNPSNNEWAVQINLGSQEKIWANPGLKEKHDVEAVVAVIR